jgi:electron transport complex protein RnfB
MADQSDKIDRRGFVADGLRVMGAVSLTGLVGYLAGRQGRSEDLVWQLDPDKCIACTNCQTYCVLDISAVKAVQCFALCGYCDRCTGYFVKDYRLDTGAENQLCPSGAITRKFIPERTADVRYFEYTIDESKCIGCGKCVKGCREMNGSLYLQVRHDRCLNCNECAIAIACPTQAFSRVPAGTPNILGKAAQRAVESLRRKRQQSGGQQGQQAPEARVQDS